MKRVAFAVLLVGCGHPRTGGLGVDDATQGAPDVGGAIVDGPRVDGAQVDGAIVDGALIDGALIDGALVDGAPVDGMVTPDAASDAATDAVVTHDSPSGPITGGPCLSGAAGAAAYRIRWANAGGQAQVVYEVDGLPDHSRDHAGAYGYQIGFTPSFVDMFLGEGGVQLDDSDFIDLELTTVGLSQIQSATLAIYGRSYNVDTDGSFNWQTFDGVGSSPTDSVSNIAPYAWYAADMTTEIHAGDSGVLVRIKSGLSSDSLVVNRIELCIVGT